MQLDFPRKTAREKHPVGTSAAGETDFGNERDVQEGFTGSHSSGKKRLRADYTDD